MSSSPKGRADYLELGTWNAVCFECGCKRKANYLRKHWQGYWVCPEHWEPRPAQDFVKATIDNQTAPWTQPEPGDVFVVIQEYIVTLANVMIATESGDLFIEE